MEGREVQSEAVTDRHPRLRQGEAPLRRGKARRRGLLVLSVVTALACGAAVGVLGPQILVGETARKPYLAAGEVAPAARSGVEPLDLDGRLGLAPQEIRVNQRRWEEMSETERLTVVAQYRRLAEMDAAERDQLLQKYQDFRQLPGDRQVDLRRRAARLAAFIQSLSLENQAQLESMTETQRAARLLELWRAREAT